MPSKASATQESKPPKAAPSDAHGTVRIKSTTRPYEAQCFALVEDMSGGLCEREEFVRRLDAIPGGWFRSLVERVSAAGTVQGPAFV